MAGTAEFDEFVRARSRHLLRIAYLLTGDHALAEDLLQTALARSWSAWRRIHGDPEAYVRKVLVNTYNSWWRRRWHGERPTEVLPEQPVSAPQAAVDERDQVWRALSRLPKQQKLVLVLRYFEDLSEAEIASALGISNGSVKSHASKALARLRLDPSLRVLPPADLDDAPAGNERVVAVRERITQRGRARLASVAAACAVVLAMVGGYLAAPRFDRRDVAEPAEFPGYQDGRRFVLHGQAPFGDRAGSFTWTPQSLDFAVYGMCWAERDDPGAGKIMMSVHVNDLDVVHTSCDSRSLLPGSSVTLSPESLRSAGVEIGKPAKVTLTVYRDSSAVGGPSPEPDLGTGGAEFGVGTMAVAIGEPVPFDQYPQPSRPATSEPLARTTGWRDDVPRTFVDSAGPRSATAEWEPGIQLYARSQTPGILHIKVNGIEVKTMTWWDYRQISWGVQLTDELKDAGIDPAPGAALTVTVEPEHMTGDWYVAIRHLEG